MRYADLTADDLQALVHLLPRTAAELISVVGVSDALALLNTMPGVTLTVPKREAQFLPAVARRRWSLVTSLISETGAQSLARHMGGLPLQIATCHQLRVEKRNRWLRAQFDELTSASGGGLSRNQAVYELGVLLAEAFGECLSAGGIERALDTPGPEAVAARVNTRQLPLFR
jgi:hypothetical protein